MNEAQFREALRAIASQEIPETMDRWSEIKEKVTPRAQTRPVTWSVIKAGTAVAVAVLALMSIAVAYAVFRGWNEPGMDSVQEAGLLVPVQATAIPVTLPVISGATPRPTVVYDAVTATIDEIYADEQRIAAVYTLYNLPDDFFGDSPYYVTVVFYKEDGSYFYTGGRGQQEPGPVSGSVTYRQVFEHNEPIPDDNILNLRMVITLNYGEHERYFNSIQNDLYKFRFDLNLDVIEATVYTVNQDQSVNGVNMTLKSISITPAGTNVELCYDLPEGSTEWVPNLSLTTDGEPGKNFVFSAGQLPDDLAGDNRRCAEVNVSTAYNPDPQQIVITVERLETISKMGPLPEDVIARAEQRAAEQGIQLEIENTEDGATFKVLSYPEGMSWEEANMIAFEASHEWYPGPWVFTVDLP